MDSYASHPPGGTDTSSTTDLDERWKDVAGSATMSPASIHSPQKNSSGETARQLKDENPHTKLKPIRTDLGDGQEEGSEVLIFSSPTSE